MMMISQQFLGLKKLSYVGGVKGFRTANRPVLHSSKHQYNARAQPSPFIVVIYSELLIAVYLNSHFLKNKYNEKTFGALTLYISPNILK